MVNTNKESISYKTARTAFWGGIEKGVNMGTQFIVMIVLARLLIPEDYAAIAILTVFINVADRLVECGVSNALIRKENCSMEDYSTGFYFNLVMSIFLYSILFLCVPMVARFYNMPILNNVLRIYGLQIIANSFTLVQYAMLSKELNFKTLAKARSVSVISSGIIGIMFAYKGFGVWALVAQGLSSSLLYALCLSINTHWIPSFVFSKKSFNYLWEFGSKMLVTGVISSVYSNLYSLLIGKAYNNQTLGLFNRGQYIAFIPMGVMESVFVRNSLPILSQIQNDKKRLIDVYRKFIVIVSFIGFPISLLLAALAKPFVLCFLTDKWLGSVIYLQIFSLSVSTAAPNSVNLSLLQVKGRSDLTMRAEIIKKAICTLVIVSLLPFGPIYVAIGGSLLSIFSYSVNLYYAKKLTDISYKTQIKDLVPCIVSAILAAVFAYGVVLVDLIPWLQLILGFIIGVFVYIVLTKYVYKMTIYSQLSNLINKQR